MQAEDEVCRYYMWSAGRGCGPAGNRCGLHTGDVVCIQEIGNLLTILFPKL
jgi:hypothetical protein